jgi:hypothetical protein
MQIYKDYMIFEVLTAMKKMSMLVFSVVTLCGVTVIHLQVHTVSQPRRPASTQYKIMLLKTVNANVCTISILFFPIHHNKTSNKL